MRPVIYVMDYRGVGCHAIDTSCPPPGAVVSPALPPVQLTSKTTPQSIVAKINFFTIPPINRCAT